jgi:integrase/recombinase XerD
MDLRSWLQTYLNYLVDERRVSRSTEQSYISDLTDLLNRLENIQITGVNELRAHHLTNYLNELRAEGRSTATITRRIVSIRSFCKFLTIKRVMDYNPAILLEAPKPERRSPQTLTPADLNALLELPDINNPIGLRDRAMLELLYATGLRVTELVMLSREHVRLDMGFLLCLGSGGRERMVPLGAQGITWVSRYLEVARPQFLNEEKLEEALFVNHQGARMTRQGFWKMLKKYGDQLSLDINPQKLRHSFATHLLDNGADIRAVQEMLGHTTTSTTQLYQSAERMKLKDVYDRSHPRARD